MHALTIYQPWAALIMLGHKRVENRGWSTRIRGRFVVHAATNRTTLRDLVASGEYARLQRRYRLPDPDRLPRGVALGTVELVDDLPLADYLDQHGPDPFALGPRCFLLARPALFPSPVTVAGRQKFWRWGEPA